MYVAALALLLAARLNALPNSSQTIIGYDCENINAEEMTEIPRRTINQCSKTKIITNEKVVSGIEIIKRELKTEANYIQCQIKIWAEVRYCGRLGFSANAYQETRFGLPNITLDSFQCKLLFYNKTLYLRSLKDHGVPSRGFSRNVMGLNDNLRVKTQLHQ